MRGFAWKPSSWLAAIVALASPILLAISCSRQPPVEQFLAAYREDGQYQDLTIRYPLNETVFPPDIVPCTFSWQESSAKPDFWLVVIELADGPQRLVFRADQTEWKPKGEEWEKIKQGSQDKPARVTVLGIQRGPSAGILSRGQVSIRTSKDPVNAPLFYREVNLPFKEAVKDPSLIRWRFGTISSPERPRVVLERLPVCGNCHSFSADGRTLGMDVDYANNKG